MALKFHFFPAVFPDETLHSVLSRYARLCGGGSRKAAFAGEDAAASFTQNVAFPSRLGDLVESLPRGLDLSVAQIIKRHTLLPYYAPFLTSSQLEHAHAAMAGDGRGLMLKLGINASRVEYASRIRFCPECLDEDIHQFGAAYWHRVHLLPGVLVCPHDGQLLKVLDPGWSSRNSRQLNLPDDEGVQAHSIQLDVAIGNRPALQQIASQSLELLNAELGPLPAPAVRGCLLQGAADLDLTCGAAQRLDLRCLAAYMAGFFQELPVDWEYAVLREAPEGLPATWVTKLLRRPRGTHHPLKYIVLACALKVDLARISGFEKPAPPADAPPSALDAHSPQMQSSTILTSELSGLPEAVWKLALTGNEAQLIASALGVSSVYVYRTIRAVEGGPSRWREARFLRERSQRRAAFQEDYGYLHAHRCRDYAWLYRRDRAWLTDCIAKYGGIHASRADNADAFAALDVRLAEQIRACARRLHEGLGKPVWISRTRIGRELHAQSRFEKQVSKLPLCVSALEQVCESAEQFHIRRLLWAEAKLVAEERRVTQSALYRTACIRPRK
ncbi:TnsD family Tn7-like transposition protein [Pseudomonas mosselii]|uniref:TnsD family Tn7-like transposition protein n=1 Tax=unclassified Pseudomonas TaxID=196821 RepID=UPI0020C39396|nr:MULTISPECIES: TnsD family Tn7-like transposition protein [unclassified Pseudomonas]MCP8632906.1 TnsD family transposase [Pseudomonas sp. DVZ6]MDD7783383.1 TnsD family Tn7-like transposition protein [Pseudomonas sp. DVZ24]